MNQEKIGKFIATCRKEKGYTQAALAEKLGITDRAISKWENGKSLPDASIMLELCSELDINVNELLSGERLEMEHYQENAENNFIAMKQADENMEHKLHILGILLLVGYGVLGIGGVCIFSYHLYLNYTDISYNGEYFEMLFPLFLIMAFLAILSGTIMDFLKKYDIVKK
ncbi:MAG: helix-turn-helix domain-containing protein [Lachnospiraceae bacterium]